MKTKLNFQEACEAFKNFLSQEGRPHQLLWLFREDVLTYQRKILLRWPLPQSNEILAAQLYEIGREKGLGINLEAFCWVGKYCCCYVLIPEDQSAAEGLMMTELKFNFPQDARQVIRISFPVMWNWLKRIVPKSKEFNGVDFIPEGD